MAVIGIDIDGTLAASSVWAGGDVISPPNPAMVDLVRILASRRHRLFAWTCRADYVVRAWLQDQGLLIYFEGINESPYPTESGKASFDFYIGDEAFRWEDNPQELLGRIEANLWRADSADFRREESFSSHNPKPYLAGVGKAYVDGFEEHWKAAWERHDHKGKPIAMMTICSHAKPYSKSFIHTSIRAALFCEGKLGCCDYIHISNAGIIPASAEMDYPFNAYDWNGDLCSREVRRYHIEAIKRRFTEWLLWRGMMYHRIVVYLREGGNTISAVQEALTHPDLDRVAHRVTVVPACAGEEHYPQFVHVRDPDDCLTSAGNLHCLTSILRRKN